MTLSDLISADFDINTYIELSDEITHTVFWREFGNRVDEIPEELLDRKITYMTTTTEYAIFIELSSEREKRICASMDERTIPLTVDERVDIMRACNQAALNNEKVASSINYSDEMKKYYQDVAKNFYSIAEKMLKG